MSEASNVQVAIRIRPMNDRERQSKQFQAWNVKDGCHIFPLTIEEQQITSVQTFSFGMIMQTFPYNIKYTCPDKIFDNHSNGQVYDQIAKELIASTIQGFNGIQYSIY